MMHALMSFVDISEWYSARREMPGFIFVSAGAIAPAATMILPMLYIKVLLLITFSKLFCIFVLRLGVRPYNITPNIL